MKILDSADVRIVRIGDNIGIILPAEYEELEGAAASFEARSEDGKLTFEIKPDLEDAVRLSIDELWGAVRLLFSEIGEIGTSPPWEDMKIVWDVQNLPDEKAHGSKVPLGAAEVLEHRHIYCAKPMEWDKEDVRKGIFDTLTKLCELAARRLGFKSHLFAMAFGDAVANKFCQISCTYGTLDVLCEIFSEEFNNVYQDRFWSLTSDLSREAVTACYRKIKYLEDHPDAFEKERARVQGKWGFPLQSP
jgi:hypothetical protein